MAFLLRLRSSIHPSPSPSLLHHHHHRRRLSTTSNSVSCLVSKKHFGILTLTNPSPSLLRHHHRLFSNSNSNHPSPSLLRELREAIKQLSVVEYILETPFIDNLSSLPPASTTIPFYSSKQPDHPTSSTTFSSLDENLEHLKVTALSLKQRQNTDRQRVSEMIESRKPFLEEMQEILVEIIMLLKSDEKIGIEIDTLDTKFTRFNEITLEFVELARVLTSSRLASLYEIAANLSDIRNNLQDDEVWNELNEGLMRFKEMEIKDFDLLAEETNLELAFFQQRITNLVNIRDNSY